MVEHQHLLTPRTPEEIRGDLARLFFFNEFDPAVHPEIRRLLQSLISDEIIQEIRHLASRFAQRSDLIKPHPKLNHHRIFSATIQNTTFQVTATLDPPCNNFIFILQNPKTGLRRASHPLHLNPPSNSAFSSEDILRLSLYQQLKYSFQDRWETLEKNGVPLKPYGPVSRLDELDSVLSALDYAAIALPHSSVLKTLFSQQDFGALMYHGIRGKWFLSHAILHSANELAPPVQGSGEKDHDEDLPLSLVQESISASLLENFIAFFLRPSR